jgi:hypothetical protein
MAGSGFRSLVFESYLMKDDLLCKTSLSLGLKNSKYTISKIPTVFRISITAYQAV